MVHHHTESHAQALNRSFTKSSLVLYRSTLPFSFLDSFDFECSKCCDTFPTFSTFSSFQPFNQHHSFFIFPITYSSSANARRSLYTIRCTGATIHNCFMWLLSLHRCRQILTSREEILALRNSSPAPGNYHQRYQGHGHGQCYAGYGMRYARCDG